ncbi:MAG TPA: FtsX-like permease family protein [Microthrixaceae bacterium]|jgi:putative ABC transport system permease protein|nr:FtsX-like permease family protein [Microthrixaceae bacterium]
MFLAIRDLRRGARRFALLGAVIALVAVLSTVLSGLATGLVTDGISGLRALPFDHLALQDGSQSTFSRSTLRPDALTPFKDLKGVEATPLGASFVNAAAVNGGPSLDLALFGVSPDSFLVDRPEARAALTGEPGLVLGSELEKEGVKVGDRYTLGGSNQELPVLGFTFAGTYGHAPIAFTSLETWQKIQYGDGADGRFSAVALHSGDDATLAKAAKSGGMQVLTKTEAYAGSPGFTAETTTMSLIRGFLLVISALVIGAFFTVLTVQRTRQIGLLKAMGASNGYVLRDGIGQMTILVAAATLAGVAIGTALVALVGQTDAPVELDPKSIATVAVSLVIAGVIGSLVAFRRITQIEPAIALGVEP